jgi:hypothetical protein
VVGSEAMNELIAASTELAVALDETRQMYIDAQSSHCNTLNVATRAIQSCITAHEVGKDDLVWPDLNQLMNTLKDLELTIQLALTSLRDRD